MDISIKGLFGRELPLLFTPSSRTIRGDHPSNIIKYIKFLAKYIETHNLLQNSQQLQNPCYYDCKKVNALDDLVTKGMLLAEQQCRMSYHLPWCKKTHKLMQLTSVIKSYISGLRNRINIMEAIQDKNNRLKKPFVFSPSLDNVNKMLRDFQKQIRILKKTNDNTNPPSTKNKR